MQLKINIISFLWINLTNLRNFNKLSTDGSHDGGEGQLYPIVVRYFDEDQGAVVTDLLTMTACIGASTGK